MESNLKNFCLRLWRGLSGLMFVWMAFGASGATYFVSVSGSDSNPGTAQLPWRTIQKAANVMVGGDTALIGPGNYGEYVVTKAHGTSNAPIRFLANPANIATNQVIARQFRVRHRFHVIEGFNLTGAQDLNNATIRIEFNPPVVDGSHTVITNNTLRDGVYLMSDDLHFDSSSNGITTLKENWLARGFAPGGYIFLGSNSKNPYANHDTPWRIKAVTANTIHLTNNSATSFVAEPVSNVWGVIYAGSGNDGYPGISIVLGSGTSAATNCTIVNNTFSNLFGCPIKLNGDNHRVEGNFVTRIHGYYGIQPQGQNHVIRGNLWKDCTNFIFFTQSEIITIPHPAGANFFDYQVAFISAYGTESTNILFEGNWLQNVHNQMALVSQATGSHGFIMRSNVFVGVQTHMSGSRSGLAIENNTYYRCSFDEGRSHVLALGGTGGQTQNGVFIRKNLFIDCGSHYSLDNEGYYGVVSATNVVADFNFVSGPETTGWAAKRYFNEPNGINGGDPVLVNPANPLGPDGLPFTADDGLRPLPNSPFALLRWGALPAAIVPEGAPVAHFRVSSPTGWVDAVGTSYNPSWELLEPYQRGDVIRPYFTPEALGLPPITVTFSGDNSIKGLDINGNPNAAIVSYLWQFGDGQVAITQSPVVSHTYTSSGNFPVTLTVSNSFGNVSSRQQRYRVLGNVGSVRPLPPANLRLLIGD